MSCLLLQVSRMLKEGTLPPGYTVKKRKLVKVAKKSGTQAA